MQPKTLASADPGAHRLLGALEHVTHLTPSQTPAYTGVLYISKSLNPADVEVALPTPGSKATESPMPKLVIITKSFKRDLNSFIDLHHSVVKYSADDVEHHVIVPDSEVAIFSNIRSGRLKVFATSTFLEGHFKSADVFRGCLTAAAQLPFVPNRLSRQTGELFFNLYRPWLPIRGWIVQQLVKIAAIARSDADVVLTLDSDVVLVRPIFIEHFLQGEAIRFYRKANSIPLRMTRHLNWWRSAHRLLGLSTDDPIELPDYISAVPAWDPSLVRSMQRRIADISGRTWLDTLARETDFSEMVVYGVYMDRVCSVNARSFSSAQALCCSYWKKEPLTLSTVEGFVEEIKPEHIAINIQSLSNTSSHVRHAAIQAAEQRC